MKYSSEGFIYPYTHEEEKDMIHNTEKQLAYDDGVAAGVEQNKIEMIKNLKDKLSLEENVNVVNIRVDKVKEILKEK